jgi:hypothetical protein
MRLSRRAVLKGLGVSIGLPMLEAMLPPLVSAWGAEPKKTPRRMAFVYVPNGVNMQTWTPNAEGRLGALPPTLAPLEPYKNDLLVLSGLTVDKARPNGDGPGDHARAMAAFLTAAQPRKTSGADIRAGISVDQLAAQRVGQATRFASLEVGCEGGRMAGSCDSGYSCAYSSNLSWRSENTPNPKEINPAFVFDRLFGTARAGDRNTVQRNALDQSVLDFVRDDAQRLRQQLGAADLRRLDEYLSSIRDVERRIQATQNEGVPDNLGMARPRGIPLDMSQHIRLFNDIIALAFQADLTRIVTFVYANEGSNRPYRSINVSEGHHDLSHHGNNKEKLEKIARINLFHMQQFAHFLGKLKNTPEADGTLLDNAMVLYGSGNGDGNRHNHDNLPILLAGRAGGTLATGRHLSFPRNTPLANLFLEMLARMGAPTERFGDSTGTLRGLTV